eukprot:1235-Heterococcus_DN1.PRE.2
MIQVKCFALLICISRASGFLQFFPAKLAASTPVLQQQQQLRYSPFAAKPAVCTESRKYASQPSVQRRSAIAMSTLQVAPPILKPPLPRYHNTYEWRGHKINYLVEALNSSALQTATQPGPADGQPILLIHGFGASVGHWRNNVPAMVERGYRTYAIDLLGFGGSDKPKEETYSLELWLELLLDFIKDQSQPKDSWVVMGNSIGGLLTLMVTEALQGTGTIKGSVLFNSADCGSSCTLALVTQSIYQRSTATKCWFGTLLNTVFTA